MSLEILKKYKIKAKKSLGQNFLVDDDVLDEIAYTLEITGKNIVEVGPGYGALTQKLIENKPKSLNLVELDKDMIEILEKRIESKDFDLAGVDFRINNIDVLKYEPNTKDYSVIANIPYYITSPILRHFLYDVNKKPENMLILMQKDVGDKILSGQDFGVNNEQGIVNNKKKNKSSVLSLFIAKKCYVDEIVVVPKESFIPAPKVESSVLLFSLHDEFKDIDDEKFLDLIKKGFREPRKMLIKNFVNSGYDKTYIIQVFDELGIKNDIRGEDLNISIWCELFRKINK